MVEGKRVTCFGRVMFLGLRRREVGRMEDKVIVVVAWMAGLRGRSTKWWWGQAALRNEEDAETLLVT